ncbi:MAG: E3 ubiquitin ligase family protein, partial [Chloroflexi bacterium]|nr:E3 ubiquitin ligase family protein [Chloroflexota bacterium]
RLALPPALGEGLGRGPSPVPVAAAMQSVRRFGMMTARAGADGRFARGGRVQHNRRSGAVNVGELVIGLCLIGVAVFLAFVFSQQRAKLALMAATPNFTAGELEDLRARPILDSGSVFPFLAEVNGVIECQQPLTAQLSGEQCVAYRMQVEREWEERKEVRDDKGNVRMETSTRSETVSSLSRQTKFVVRDSSGTIELDPDGADLDMQDVYDHFEPADDGAVRVRFGGFSFNVEANAGGMGARTLGYRAKEWALLPGKRIYVLGEIQEQGKRLVIAKPTGGDTTFMVSTKTEKELKSSANTGQWLALAGAVSLALGGVGLTLHALIARS